MTHNINHRTHNIKQKPTLPSHKPWPFGVPKKTKREKQLCQQTLTHTQRCNNNIIMCVSADVGSLCVRLGIPVFVCLCVSVCVCVSVCLCICVTVLFHAVLRAQR